MFSLNDIDQTLEIKDLIDQGVNLAGIKEIFSVKISGFSRKKRKGKS